MHTVRTHYIALITVLNVDLAHMHSQFIHKASPPNMLYAMPAMTKSIIVFYSRPEHKTPQPCRSRAEYSVTPERHHRTTNFPSEAGAPTPAQLYPQSWGSRPLYASYGAHRTILSTLTRSKLIPAASTRVGADHKCVERASVRGLSLCPKSQRRGAESREH